MKTTLSIAIAAVAWTTTARAADTHESLAEQMIATMDEYTKVLTAIRDVRTAEEAREKLDELAKTVKSLVGRTQELGIPEREIRTKLAREYQPRIEASLRKIDAEKRRIRDTVDGGTEIADRIEKTFDRVFRKDKN